MLLALHRPADAARSCRAALALRNDYFDAQLTLAAALRDLRQFTEAADVLQAALRLRPDHADAWNNLASVRLSQMRFNEALEAARNALNLRRDHPDAWLNLAAALTSVGQHGPALPAAQQGVLWNPASATAQINLGNALKETGDLDGAIAAYRRAVELAPDAGWHGTLIYTLSFHPAYSDADILAEARQWDRRQVRPLAHLIRPHRNEPDPDRPLRIGYLSPYFRDHVVGLNLLPILQKTDRANFPIYCYSTEPLVDSLTDQFRACADGWRDITAMDDDAAAELIRDDGIDILIDSAMHLFGARPLLLARKPAPIQIEWLAYPGTTGNSAVDYRLTDPYLDPPGTGLENDRSIRLPDSFWCYQPTIDEPVGPLPALQNGCITFGCLNNFCKVNPAVLSLWSRVLRAVPHSRLLLMCPEGRHRSRVIEQLAVSPERIEFVAHQPRAAYLQTHHRIDIALDTFPYNGHTTSLDALWMGVPVVTRIGSTVAGRAGWSQLNNLGLTQLAARVDEQFVGIAVELSKNIPQLSAIRASLREQMTISPLCGIASFCSGLQSTYRKLWQHWCASATPL